MKEQLDASLVSFTGREEELHRRIESLTMEIASKDDHLQKMDQDFQSERRHVQEREQQLQSVAQEFSDYKKAMEELSSKLNQDLIQANAEIELQRKNFVSLSGTYESVVAEHAQQRTNLELQILNYQKLLDSEKMSVKEEQDVSQRLQEGLAALELEKKGLEETLAMEKNTSKTLSEEKLKLQEQLCEVTAQLAQLEERHSSLESSKSILMEEYQTICESLAMMSSDRDCSLETIAVQEHSLVRERQQRQALESELEAIRSAHSSAKSELDGMNALLSKELEELRISLMVKSSDLGRAQASVSDYSEELATLKASYALLDEELRLSQTSLRESRGSFDHYMTESKMREERLALSTAERIQVLEQMVSDANTALTRAEAEGAQKSSSFEAAIKEWDEKRLVLETEITSLRQSHCSTSEELQQTRSTLEQTAATLEEELRNAKIREEKQEAAGKASLLTITSLQNDVVLAKENAAGLERKLGAERIASASEIESLTQSLSGALAEAATWKKELEIMQAAREAAVCDKDDMDRKYRDQLQIEKERYDSDRAAHAAILASERQASWLLQSKMQVHVTIPIGVEN